MSFTAPTFRRPRDVWKNVACVFISTFSKIKKAHPIPEGIGVDFRLPRT
jgi:hypothetical protein